jgi:uncharacterized membrane protein YebE (DUF533 family)
MARFNNEIFTQLLNTRLRICCMMSLSLLNMIGDVMPDFWDWASRAITVTQQTIEQAAQVAQETAQGAAETINRGVTDAAAWVAGEPAEQPLDLTALPEAQRAAFYGALFAMAAADGMIDKDELQQIFELIDLAGISAGGRRVIQGYIIQPPRLLDTLQALCLGDEALRYRLMVDLIDVAWANDLVSPEQRYALEVAGRELQITAVQVAAIEQFVGQLKTIRARGIDDSYAAAATKQAAAGLAAVGVPIAAVYLSGSVLGLSAAGITSGLAALGLGLGMVPGIGVAILVGTGIYIGVSRMLDAAGVGGQSQLRAAAERKAKLANQNLQEMIRLLSECVQQLQHANSDPAITHELNQRLRALQQILAKRQRQSGAR